MQFFSVSEDYVDVDKYDQRLNEVGYIYVDLISLGIYAQHQACMTQTYQRLCLKYMNAHATLGYSGLNSSSIIDYLTNVEHIPIHHFKKKGVQGASIDKTKVLEPLRLNGHAVDFLDMYFTYAESKSRYENTMSVFNRNIGNESVKGWNGVTLYKVPFNAKPQVNLRFNYSKEDIIGFPREVKPLIQAPEDYVLVWGDFAQSDARIAFNTLLKDDFTLPIVEQFPEDIYAGFANLVSHYTMADLNKRLEAAKKFMEGFSEDSGLPPDDFNVRALEKEIASFRPFSGFKGKEERELYKVNSLRTMYGTRYDSVRQNSEFISKFSAVLNMCPKYKQFWDDVSTRASFGVPLKVKCYMGHIEQVAAFDGKRLHETLFKCLNYPVQGGTSEMMILLVNRILDRFYDMGYTPEDIRVYYARHDEPIFIMKKSVMKDSWIFKDFEVVQVDDWIPLRMDFSFGKIYSQTDDDLMNEYSISRKANADRITKDIKPSEPVPYYPLPKMLVLGSNVLDVGNNQKIVTLYDPDTNKADVRSVVSEFSPNEVLYKTVEKFAEVIYREGYRQLVVENSMSFDLVEESGSVILTRIYRSCSGPNTLKANIISLSAKAKLLGEAPEPIVEENADFLKSVRSLNLFKGV